MYCFPTHKLNLLKQMSNTLVAANVTAESFGIEKDERAQREVESRHD